MHIVDAHHHIWIPQQNDPELGYGWLRDIGALKPFGDPTPIQRDYTWDEYIAESNKHTVAGSVYVQVDGAIADPVAETAWVQSVVNKPADQFGIVGLVNLSGDKAQEHIEQQVRFASFKGVRQIISFLDDNPQLCFSAEHLLRNAQWRDQFALLAEHALSFDLQLYPEQMQEAAIFLAEHPSVPVVIDHAGSPYDQSDAGIDRWQAGLSALSELPNISIKLSGFGMFDTQWNTSSVAPLIDYLLTTFGSERIMFGSNFPVDKLMSQFDDTVDRVLACIAPQGNTVVDAVFVDNAKRFYRLA